MWLCMVPAKESSSSVKKFAYKIIFLLILVINFGCTISGYMYFFVYISTDFKGCLFAFMASSATLVVIYTMISAYYMRFEIKQLFVKLSIICSGSKYSVWRKNWKMKSIFKIAVWLRLGYDTVSIELLTEANNNSEWLCKICILYLISAVVSTAMLSIIVGIYCFIINESLDVNHLYHPLNLM